MICPYQWTHKYLTITTTDIFQIKLKILTCKPLFIKWNGIFKWKIKPTKCTYV